MSTHARAHTPEQSRGAMRSALGFAPLCTGAIHAGIRKGLIVAHSFKVLPKLAPVGFGTESKQALRWLGAVYERGATGDRGAQTRASGDATENRREHRAHRRDDDDESQFFRVQDLNIINECTVNETQIGWNHL